jgi:Protein of unknown function (DUF3048) N-terminal domain/Protein of unknown function (DUF3048) C-terminal domain
VIRTRRTIASLLVLSATMAACGGGDDSADTTTATSDAPTTTAAATTTEAPTTDATTTTTTPAVPLMPLTGLPVSDPALAERPALIVKIDDNPKAHPQAGLNQADIVYEEIVEENTRFAAVFQSQDSDPVGPIRSGRTQDVLLFGSYNNPLFAWSGGNAGVTDAIAGSDFVNLSAQINAVYQGGGFYRERGRSAPHNLMASTTALRTLTPPDAVPPPQQFQYLGAEQTAEGESASGVDLTMDSLDVGWTYDPATATYLRTEDGDPHVDTADAQLAATNVLVIVCEYLPSPADRNSPEAQTIGFGEAYLFTAGKVVHGGWLRAEATDVFTLTDEDGQPLLLTPGNTWVELAEPDTTRPRLG